MKQSPIPILLLLLILIPLSSCTSFSIQVTSTCTNLTGGVCTGWSQSGSIIQQTSACLPGQAELLLENGSFVRMDRLRVKDRVLAYNPETSKNQWTEVRFWLHREEKTRVGYLRLEMERGALVISPEHNVAVERHGYRFGMAKEVEGLVGMEGQIWKIINVTQINKENNEYLGAYAPLTGLNNYYVRVGDKAVLVHAYAHIREPEKYEKVFSWVMEWYSYFVGSEFKGEESYWHPVARVLAYLVI